MKTLFSPFNGIMSYLCVKYTRLIRIKTCSQLHRHSLTLKSDLKKVVFFLFKIISVGRKPETNYILSAALSYVDVSNIVETKEPDKYINLSIKTARRDNI